MTQENLQKALEALAGGGIAVAGDLVLEKHVEYEVGKNRIKGQVLDSRIWLHRLKRKITEAKQRGEAVWLTVE